MGRWIGGCCIVCCLAGCPSVRAPGPTADDVGKIFTWKMHAAVNVTDTGCPSQANLEGLKRDLPGSHLFARLDSKTAATGMYCADVADLASCVEIDETAAPYHPREQSVVDAHFTGNVTAVAAQLATDCSLMVDSTFNLEDKGATATLKQWLIYRKQEVATCLPAILVNPAGDVIDRCTVDVVGDLDLVSVRDAPG